jgi:uncharacterized OB-fold protein
MGFENFGTVSFTAEAKTADFVSYLEQGKVMATKCTKCGTIHFPPKMDCPKCQDSGVEWVEIKNAGKLLTHTTVHYGPSGFENDAPYTLGIVDFGDGLRVFGRISKAIDVSTIKAGMELKAVPVKLSDDRISYEFEKA